MGCGEIAQMIENVSGIKTQWIFFIFLKDRKINA